MSGGARDGEAARIAARGFLVSIGAIALLAWFSARYLAEWAVMPLDWHLAQQQVGDGMSARDHFEMSKWDFRNAMAGMAVTMGWLVAVYWLLAYVLGTARLTTGPRSRTSDPSVLLGAAIVAGTGIGFLAAAGRFVVGPLVDACTRRYHAANPQDFSSFGIHSCESWVGNGLLAVFVLLVVGLMAASLWRRWRLRGGGGIP